MLVSQLLDEDFVNYKLPSMFIGTSKCSFKCDKEAGTQVCQNSALATSKRFEITPEELRTRYINNPITKAIVIGGLEPFDTALDLYRLVVAFRTITSDPVVIYTGYTEEEIESKHLLDGLRQWPNIIIKFGRYVPGQKSHFDDVLGVELASDNQYAKELK